MTEMAYHKPWLIFWLAAVLAHGYMDYCIWKRIRSWRRGQRGPDGLRWTPKAIRVWLMEVLLQRQLLSLSFSRWVIHMLVFWGFLCLGALSLFLFFLSLAGMAGIDQGLRSYFTYGSGYALRKIWGDGFGLFLLLGLLAASFRRIVFRSRQLLNDQSDILLLILLIWLTLSGFILEGLRLGNASPELSRYSFVGRYFVLPLALNSPRAALWLTPVWVVHAFSALGLLIYIPKSKLLHGLFGPVVIALNAADEQERKDIYWPSVKGHRPIE